MIKCNVKVCGIINRAASVRQTAEGKPFVAFGLSVAVPATKGDAVNINISVAADNSDVASLAEGRRVAVDGILKIKGAPEKRQYFNLSAENIDLDPVAESGIGGDMVFRGTLCKDIVTPTDKKGNRFLRFSAYSTMSFTVSLSALSVSRRRWSHSSYPKGRLRQRASCESHHSTAILTSPARLRS